MPGEFIPETIHIGMECRTSLQHYYTIGGDHYAFGVFKGQVLKIEKNKGYLFKRLSVEFNDSGCYWDDDIQDWEDHVWIYDSKPFKDADIQVGDSVRFTALAYAYKRQDGTEDFGLKHPQDIIKINGYEILEPTDISYRFIEDLICDICLYSEQCDRLFCIAPEGYKESMTKAIQQQTQKSAASNG